jgi:acyl-CoA dehydrogenase
MKTAIERLRENVLPIAASESVAVDREGRFPKDTFAALKGERLLGVMIPHEFGGEGLSLLQVADLCSTLGQVCGSSALIYAMHHIKTSSLVFHARGSAWHESFLARVARDQLLLGSATTEGGGIGGDLRSSICAVERHGEGARQMFHLEKDATVISYGEHCDAILVTARKDAASPASDQVLVVGERHQTSLTKTGGWNTFGMRGTCSDGFALSIDAPAEQIFPLPFAEIAAQSMLAHTHILWSSVWYGIAAEAASRAQALVRSETRRRSASATGQNGISPGAGRLAELMTELQAMRGVIVGGIERLERAHRNTEQLATVSFLIDMNALKISASRAVVDILNRSMEVCGIHGYRNDTPFSLDRLMRDAHSAPIMINNDRILANMANLALMNRSCAQLGG